jgi:AcrR family transcriptional regulator
LPRLIDARMRDETPVDGDDASASPGRAPAADRLLAATMAAIDEGGEGNVKVQDIADAAGVQIPILYRKFGSRDGLIQAAHIARLRRQTERELGDWSDAMREVETPEQFEALLRTVLAAVCAPERSPGRMKRINIIGSTYGRPALARAISDAQHGTISGIAAVFRHAEQQGWLRQGLDVEAFSAWLAGLTLGRVVIELGESPVDETAWNSMYIDAVLYTLLGR